MITLGIDLSSSKDLTVACAMEWMNDRVLVRSPALRCSDDELKELISKTDVIGIDAPFGWPRAFVQAVADWTGTTWSRDVRIPLQFRETDLQIQKETGIWPLSVSTDRIALPAMRAMALLLRHHVSDRSGDEKFFEVYPSASLKQWGLPFRNYKNVDEQCFTVRRDILEQLTRKLPWLKVPQEYALTSDALDSLIASLTARAAIPPSTLRGQPSGTIAAARHFLSVLPLEQFGIDRPALFYDRLDATTEKLRLALPNDAQFWGISRKALNIFLHNAFYNSYLNKRYHLDAAESLFEVPLDSITAKRLHGCTHKKELPKWKGMMHLGPAQNKLYQEVARRFAKGEGIAPVHLDAYWWGGDREAEIKQ